MEKGKELLEQRINQYGLQNCLIPEKPFHEMTIQELSEYITAFRESSYDSMVAKTMNYEQKEKIVQPLNEEVSRRFQEKEILEIYNWLDKEGNKEKWAGEIRYQILAYEAKPYTETTQVLLALKIKEFLDEYKIPFNAYLNLQNELGNLNNFYFGKYKQDGKTVTKQEQTLNEFLNTL